MNPMRISPETYGIKKRYPFTNPYEKGLVVPLTNEEWENWSEPWKKMFDVKVLGRKVNFKVLKAKLQRSWTKGRSISIIDMLEDFYLVKFSMEEDYSHSLFEGPWMMASILPY